MVVQYLYSSVYTRLSTKKAEPDCIFNLRVYLLAHRLEIEGLKTLALQNTHTNLVEISSLAAQFTTRDSSGSHALLDPLIVIQLVDLAYKNTPSNSDLTCKEFFEQYEQSSNDSPQGPSETSYPSPSSSYNPSFYSAYD